MQVFYKQTQLPKIKHSSVIPKGQDTTFVITFESKKSIGGEFRQPAIALVEHMDIVTESRKLIGEGKMITWEEFYKTHAHKRRK